MKYTKQNDQDKIRKAVNVFMAERGLKFRKVCRDLDLNHDSIYSKIFRGGILHDDVVSFVKKIDPGFTLVRYGMPGQETFKIMRQ